MACFVLLSYYTCEPCVASSLRKDIIKILQWTLAFLICCRSARKTWLENCRPKWIHSSSHSKSRNLPPSHRPRTVNLFGCLLLRNYLFFIKWKYWLKLKKNTNKRNQWHKWITILWMSYYEMEIFLNSKLTP